jgi:predicted 3-demethylubiquinone-9 3-methyltransferase (glyoxalase superfamily)
MATTRKKITPFLMFKDQAEEAVNFYVSMFSNSKIVSLIRSGAGTPGTKGSVTGATFQLAGQEFMAYNGGPHFTFSEGMSLYVDCETQEEVDRLWEKLSQDGEKGRCGWLKDKYGVSWQIVPSILGEMLQDKDAERSKRVMEAFLKMNKLDIRALKQAYGRP